jgi:hypothetical protein
MSVSWLTWRGRCRLARLTKKKESGGCVHGDGCETELIYSQKQNKQPTPSCLKEKNNSFSRFDQANYSDAAGARALVGWRQLGILGEGPLPKVLSPLLRWRHLPSNVHPTLLLDQIKTNQFTTIYHSRSTQNLHTIPRALPLSRRGLICLLVNSIFSDEIYWKILSVITEEKHAIYTPAEAVFFFFFFILWKNQLRAL